MAVDAGVSVLAIADHDSVEGLDAAMQAAEKTGVTLVPAVELSAVADGRDLHMLGYFIDHRDLALLAELGTMRQARLARAESMVTALNAAGYDVEVEDVLRMSDGGAVGRSHVARALVATGAAATVREAFERLIGHGRPFYIAKTVKSPAEAIATIHGAGGLAVIAHPGVNHIPDELVLSLCSLGLDGVEAYHADHSAEQRQHYAEFARRHALITTGGTDFHGPGAPNPALGSVEVPEDAVRAFLARGQR
jgi:predicted metal-dependent phosphoesterase TrpH